jgi:hypothetical protein
VAFAVEGRLKCVFTQARAWARENECRRLSDEAVGLGGQQTVFALGPGRGTGTDAGDEAAGLGRC